MLKMQAQQWRTPDSPGAGGPRNRKDSIGQGHQTTIAEQAEHWPTPEAHFNARGPGFSATDSHYKPHDLATKVDQWPTPQSKDTRSGVTGDIKKKNARPLCEVASQSSLQARRTLKPGANCSTGTPNSPRQLNPAFVELLMGLPAGWTDAEAPASSACELWVTASSQWLRLMLISASPARWLTGSA
jgi:hypothetical protein